MLEGDGAGRRRLGDASQGGTAVVARVWWLGRPLWNGAPEKVPLARGILASDRACKWHFGVRTHGARDILASDQVIKGNALEITKIVES